MKIGILLLKHFKASMKNGIFLDTQQVNDADSNFAKTLMYIKAKDVSNSSGELLALTEQLRFLHENEGLSLRNIL